MKDNGGAAFPATWTAPFGEQGSQRHHAQGMSLRDYFAGQALSNGAVPLSDDTDEEIANYAKTAYRVADAMLAERAKGE